MKTKIGTLMMTLAFIGSGCATTLSKEAKKVRLLRNSDPPAHCEELGIVTGGAMYTITEQSRLNSLRESALEMGGDTVRLDRRGVDNMLKGTAFLCNKKKKS